jgi:hypothetical protein
MPSSNISKLWGFSNIDSGADAALLTEHGQDIADAISRSVTDWWSGTGPKAPAT